MGQGLGNKHFVLVFSHSGETDVFVPSTSAKHIFFYNVCSGSVSFIRIIKLSPAEIREASSRQVSRDCEQKLHHSWLPLEAFIPHRDHPPHQPRPSAHVFL